MTDEQPKEMGPFSSVSSLKSKLKSKQNILNSEELQVRRVRNGTVYNGGRPAGSKDLPPFLREVVGLTALRDGPVATARAFGLNRNTVEGAVKGATHYNRTPDADLKQSMDSARQEIRSRCIDTATQKLLNAVGLIDDDEVAGLGAMKQADIAVKLSGVVDRLTEKKQEQSSINLGVILYAPNPRDESKYPTIEASVASSKN